MQRRRTQMILGMVPPIDSGDSSEDDEPEEIIELKGSKCESPLPDEADENEIDEFLRDIELNPFEEVILFYIKISNNISLIFINIIFGSLCLILEMK